MAKKQPEKDRFSFFEPDRGRLDEEWVAQPRLYFQWAEKLADARKRLEELKSEYDLVWADVELDVRSDPIEHGLTKPVKPSRFGKEVKEEKPTEAAIKACVMSNKDVIAANQAVIDAKHEVDVLTAAVTALDHRKKALENLVTLHGQEYFAAPKNIGRTRREG